MKYFRRADSLPLNAIITLAVVIILVTACGIFTGGNGSNSGGVSAGNSSRNSSGNAVVTGWKVWVKTSPCAGGRTDWIAVARTNPTEGGGGSFWQTADLILNPQACTTVTDDSCTFAQADASAAVVRASGKFSSYCCRVYSVWRNGDSGRMSIVEGKYATAGPGWERVKSDLCCEEAAALSGIPNACSSIQAPILGNTSITGRTPINSNSNTATTNGADRATGDLEGTIWLIPSQFDTLSIFKVKSDNTVEAGQVGDSKIRWTGTYKNKLLELQNPYYAGTAEYERIKATVNGSTMTGNHSYKVYTDKSDEPFTGYCINCWINWTTFGLIGVGCIVIIGGIMLRWQMKKPGTVTAGKKSAPVKAASAEEKPAAKKVPDTATAAKKIRLSRRCAKCSQVVPAGNTSCSACGTSI